MPIAIDPAAVRPFTLESERGVEGATVFFVRPLSARVRRALRNGTMTRAEDGTTHVAIGSMEQDRVAYGVVRWEGWLGVDGEAVPLELVKGDHGERLANSVLDRLRDSELAELSEAVAELDTLDPTQGS